MKNKGTKRLRLFDITRDGKGIGKKDADIGNGIKGFFVSYKNHFNKILTTNIIMVLGNFPAIFIIAALSGYSKIESFLPIHDLFQNLTAFFANEPPSPHTMALYAITGIHAPVLVPSVWTYVLYGVGALFLFTFGCVNVGTAYILRNLAKGEPVFVWSDFWYAVKRNWKQALPFGIIDAGIIVILIMNINTLLSLTGGGFFYGLLLWANIIIFALFFFMRFYAYVQMVTFKLSIWKIIKNSFIFALLGFKRNIVALLGILLAVVLEVGFIFAFNGILISFGVALPLLLLFSSLAYMKVYAAYFKIKEIMIDPYLAEHPEECADDSDVEVVMTDDVTERQRLDEIKRNNGIVDDDDE